MNEYIFPARVVKVVDGDTIDVDFDLGFGLTLNNQRLRLYGIDAAEKSLRGGGKGFGDKYDEKEIGLKALAEVKTLLPIGSRVMIETYKDPKGKYGRWLATVWVNNAEVGKVLTESSEFYEAFYTHDTTWHNLNAWLVRVGYAVEASY